MTRVLVTGGTGFIGSHLTERLLREGYEVWLLLRRRRQWLPPQVHIVGGDLSTGEIPELKGFHHVFHIAGLTRAVKPEDFFRVNAEGTEVLVNRIVDSGGISGRFIYLSSLAAQGPTTRDRPLKEEDPPRPVSPYGESKLQGERACLLFKDRLPVGILRPSAVYGPRDDYMLELFRVIARGVLPRVGKGERWISLCYVADVVEALLRAAEREYPSGEVFLISDGRRYSLQELADMVASFLGVTCREVRVPVGLAKAIALLGEAIGRLRGKAVAFNRNKLTEALQEAWICDISKARRVLGFEPRYPLAEGLKITLRWYREAGWL